jgi:hypothetical protein
MFTDAFPRPNSADGDINPGFCPGRKIDHANSSVSRLVVGFNAETRCLIFLRFVVLVLDWLLWG